MYYNDSSMSILILISMLIFIVEIIGTYYRHEFLQKPLGKKNELMHDFRIYSSFDISKKKRVFSRRICEIPT